MSDDKATDSISFRLPDERKDKFETIVRAEGKNVSSVLVEYITLYIERHEEFIRTVAPKFGYERVHYQEKRCKTSQDESSDD